MQTKNTAATSQQEQKATKERLSSLLAYVQQKSKTIKAAKEVAAAAAKATATTATTATAAAKATAESAEVSAATVTAAKEATQAEVRKAPSSSSKSKGKDKSITKTRLPDYHFNADKQLAPLEITLRPEIEVRPYQTEALKAIVHQEDPDPQHHTASSGIIVLPCGAGKSLTSILVASAIRKPVLVVCSTIIAAEQFCNEFLRFTTLLASKTGMFAGAKKWPFNGPSGVLFTTYTMLVENRNRTSDSRRMSTFIENTAWGVIILDEVHQVPAHNYSIAICKLKAQVRLGLTATLLREDEKIGDLNTIVGPTLYHAKWKELADRGYIAKVICTQVEMSMPFTFQEAYDQMKPSSSMLGHSHHIKSLLAILNPTKMQICQRLVQFHEAKGDKVLVFCDHIDAIKLYAEKLNCPLIHGATPTDEARQLLQRFQIEVPKESPTATWAEKAAQRAQRTKQINTLFLSRIGDTSLDLPAATVIIQVSSHFGSRRQEAQRLGRILRAKKRSEKGFYSRFYTLVTTNTHEVNFSEKRRQFLEEDCGYGYQLWLVGKETEEGGWDISQNTDASGPEDDEVRLDPLTCHVKSLEERPYASIQEQKKLVAFLHSLKNIQVEDMEEVPAKESEVVGTKRKRGETIVLP